LGASARFANGQVIQGQYYCPGIHTAYSDPLDDLTRTLADGHTFNGYTLKDLDSTILSFAGASVVAAARGDSDAVVRFARCWTSTRSVDTLMDPIRPARPPRMPRG
jgi:hypothetical protein